MSASPFSPLGNALGNVRVPFFASRARATISARLTRSAFNRFSVFLPRPARGTSRHGAARREFNPGRGELLVRYRLACGAVNVFDVLPGGFIPVNDNRRVGSVDLHAVEVL